MLALPRCDRNLSCGVNSNCFRIESIDTCVCNPGYKNVSGVCKGKGLSCVLIFFQSKVVQGINKKKRERKMN